MNYKSPREGRSTPVPTIYHQDDIDVKRPRKAQSAEYGNERSRRSESFHSYNIGAQQGKKRQSLESSESSEAAKVTDLPKKPMFYETIIEKNNFDDEDENEYEPRNPQFRKPYVFEGGRNYPDYKFSNSNYPQYTRRNSPGYYAPPRFEDPDEDSSIGWSRIRRTFREPISEFFGVFILVLIGDGSIAQVVLSRNTKGDWQSINWAFAVGLMLGVYTSGISGSHINPAVTITNCILRKFSWYKLPIYVIAQTLGAFVAAGVVYGNYQTAINIFEGGKNRRTVPGFSKTATAGIFATYPQDFMTRGASFFTEFIGSAILMFCIYMLQDKKNMGAGKLLPVVLLFLLFGLGASFGWQTGYALNGARDFGPRLMTYFLGYGTRVWTASGNYFWIPIVAPIFGCLFGGLLYDIFFFTGDSLINTPLKRFRDLGRPDRRKNYYV